MLQRVLDVPARQRRAVGGRIPEAVTVSSVASALLPLVVAIGALPRRRAHGLVVVDRLGAG
jgi:hypothetical protein